MGESIKHIELVNLIYEYVNNLAYVENCFIEVDSPYSLEKPAKTLDGFRPDILYSFSNDLIIGEAKTEFDYNKEHSLNQYKSYLKKCDCFQGNKLFILAVPLNVFISSKNLLLKIKKVNKFDVPIIIINDFKGFDRI